MSGTPPSRLSTTFWAAPCSLPPASRPLWAALAPAGPSWPCPKSPLGREKVEPLFAQLLLKAHLSHTEIPSNLKSEDVSSFDPYVALSFLTKALMIYATLSEIPKQCHVQSSQKHRNNAILDISQD